MLNKIVFEGLFKQFNYNIKLNEGVTILTGPNGFGKSTILRAIDAFCSFNINFFMGLNFDKIKYYSDKNDEPIIFEKKEKILNIYLSEQRKEEINIDIESLEDKLVRKLRRPYYRRIDEDKWYDRRRDDIFTVNEFLKESLESLSFDYSEDEDIDTEKYELLKSKCEEYSGDTKFIRAQRLLKTKYDGKYSEYRATKVIEEVPEKIRSKINAVSSDYSSKANQLDSSYPERLFKTKEGITEEEYKNKIASIKEKLEKLNKFNISEISRGIYEDEFKEEFSKALKVYFDDFDSKYEVFGELIGKLEIFTRIINEKLHFKTVKISRDNGMKIYSEKTGEEITLNDLSSGEQQEIILIYELIFESEEGINLLIDEPEISLHVEWQSEFMEDLVEIIKVKKFNTIIATHSPEIIANNWDLVADLGALYNG